MSEAIQGSIPQEHKVSSEAPVKSSLDVRENQTVGVITKTIGVGQEASNSFIYITIYWSFMIGSVSSGALWLMGFVDPVMTITECLEMIKGVWSVFVPLITLALGYAFGKGK